MVTVFVLIGQTVLSQCPVICHGSISTALDESGESVITPDLILQSNTSGCTGTFTVEITDTLGNSYGDTVNGDLIGVYLIATVTHSEGNACSSELTVVDNLSPVIECEDLFIYCNVDPHPNEIGYPNIYDNASSNDSLTIAFSDVFTDLDCFSILNDSTVTGQIVRTWSAIDESGNEGFCVQNIGLLRATLDMVEFPPNFDGFEEPPLECGVDDPEDLDFTGWPTINNYPLTNSSDCELIVTYTDQVNPICGGEIKIIRTWFVFDICTDDTRVFAQIIRLNDTQAPVISCPTDVNYTTYTNSCIAQVYLPQATASDLCSSLSITPTWEFGEGNGPYNNVPAGAYTVTYIAEDDCGNQSDCEINVVVEDDDPPTPLCENQISIVLQSDGTALIYAETFDDGSHDNCGISSFLVSRDDNPYDEFVYFDCGDIGDFVPVTLKVTDVNDLENWCVSNVAVEDNVAPEIICPPGVNLDCGADYSNTGLTGEAFATDNCGLDNVSFNDFVQLNSCGVGTITRLWSATDMSGNVVSCTQEITITDNTPLSVEFPGDILTYECGFNTDPSNTGEPILAGNDCEQLGISNTDFVFYTAYPACYKIVRNWAVIDWCTFQPNDPNGAGIWEHTQIIEILDSEAPVLTCPSAITVGIEDTNMCETYAELEIPTVEDCSEQVSITSNSIYAFENGEDASGVYPMGVHTIMYTAYDGCGNTDECTTTLTVIDTEPPSPVCNNGVSVTIQQNGLVTITPALIEGGSSDNCSDYNDLIFQISPNTFSCSDEGNQTVTLTATDDFGNSSFCQTTVVVQDNLDVCDENPGVTIAGKLEAESGEPLSQKLVGLSGGISMAVHTDVDGTYDFQNLPVGNDYTVTPTYDTEPLNGVSTLDLVFIRKHILGIDPLGTPYKIIAADVNGSNSVSTLDLVELRRLILNIIDDFSNNTSWRFVPVSYEFPDPTNPFQETFPEEVNLDNLSKNEWNIDFVGIKVGDVNSSADPANLVEADDRTKEETLNLFTDEVDLEAGYEYEIPIYAKNFENILGYQFTLNFETDYLELIDLFPAKLVDLESTNFGLTQLDEGIITTSWESIFKQQLSEEDVLFYLHFYSKKDVQLSEVLSLSSDKLTAEAYAGDFTNISMDNVEFRDIVLGFEKTNQSKLELYQNNPNPTQGFTTVSFYLPKASSIVLTIYDVLGNKIASYDGTYTQGTHQIDLNLHETVERAGILLYELQVPGFKPQMKKMIYAK